MVNSKLEELKRDNYESFSREPLKTEENIRFDLDKKSKPYLTESLLDAKVNNYIDWYYENYIKGSYGVGLVLNLKNFIEKMAVWYELRYPDYEVQRILSNYVSEDKNINTIMFKDNKYLKDVFESNSDISYLDWCDFYNANVFFKSLTFNERAFITAPVYSPGLYPKDDYNSVIYLTSDGFVTQFEGLEDLKTYNIANEDLINKHITEVLKLMKEKHVNLSIVDELEYEISRYNRDIYKKDEFLNAVMYRIMERGGASIGPRRAFLFAQEFNRNIDIPLIYGINLSDPGLRSFMNAYLKAGGSKDLECYTNYYYHTKQSEPLKKIKIQYLIINRWNDLAHKYTEEETKLHQNLVNLLNNRLNEQLKLERNKNE